jgi:hypothetical protein
VSDTLNENGKLTIVRVRRLGKRVVMGVNRRHKDSLFSWLFSDPPVLRELYGALASVPAAPSLPITINTLEDVLFMERINDISFEIGDKMVVLLEHQSTINPNITLRLLMYIARIYEKIISGKNIYSGKKLYLPWPEFYVLYNGTASYADKTTLRLSDSYEDLAGLGLTGDRPPQLELVATIYNINQGHNEAIARRCEKLNHYSAFIAKVRDYGKEHDREEAMKMAIRYCIEHDILKDFLETNASEVINMLMTEWNWDDAKEVWQAEAREEGLEKGLEEGAKKTARNALNEGLPMEIIQKITGLDLDTINSLSSQR